MRISDWSSDVCSSDLVDALIDRGGPLTAAQNEELYETHFGFANQAANVQKTSKEIQDSIRQVLQVLGEASDGASSYRQALQENVGSLHDDSSIAEIGRASCRERVWQYV